MPSSTPKLPGQYPDHWEAAVKYLAAQWSKGLQGEVVIERALTGPRCNTLATRARAMRISLQTNLSWGELLHDFAKSGCLSVHPVKELHGLAIVLRAKKHVVVEWDKVLP